MLRYRRPSRRDHYNCQVGESHRLKSDNGHAHPCRCAFIVFYHFYILSFLLLLLVDLEAGTEGNNGYRINAAKE
jgi:hypothetical protein